MKGFVVVKEMRASFRCCSADQNNVDGNLVPRAFPFEIGRAEGLKSMMTELRQQGQLSFNKSLVFRPSQFQREKPWERG